MPDDQRGDAITGSGVPSQEPLAESFRCASPACPGLPWKASDSPHPCPPATSRPAYGIGRIVADGREGARPPAFAELGLYDALLPLYGDEADAIARGFEWWSAAVEQRIEASVAWDLCCTGARHVAPAEVPVVERRAEEAAAVLRAASVDLLLYLRPILSRARRRP